MKHVVGFSGGIDSQACARWVLNRYPAEDVILLNSNAGGNEHPLTEVFVREYSETVHPVTAANAAYKDYWKTEGFAESKGHDSNAPLTFPGLGLDQWRIRRITPREAERLQGMPDDYTLVPYRGRMMADGPRYKMLGNSMPSHVVRWIGKRIDLVDGMTAGDARPKESR